MLEVTNANGSVSWTKVFLKEFNAIPSKYEIVVDSSNAYDVNYIIDHVNEIFPNCEYFKYIIANEAKTSSVNEDIDDVLNISNKASSDVCIIDRNNSEIWYISDTNINIYCSEINLDRINEIRSKFQVKTPESNKGSVKLVALDNGYYYTIKSNIKETSVDLNENYNDDFKKVYDDTIEFLNDRSTGLALLYGTKGSGKTTMIKHLVTNTDKNYLIVTNAIAAHLAEPEFISFLLSQKDSVFILEDCEQILMERENNLFGGAIANILNMSDGILSDIFNIKFICTFNTSIEKIDKALLRKGRCKINYEFKELTADKVEKLAKKLKINMSEYKAMTLADIYNYSEEVKEKKTRKIGFH